MRRIVSRNALKILIFGGGVAIGGFLQMGAVFADDIGINSIAIDGVPIPHIGDTLAEYVDNDNRDEWRYGGHYSALNGLRGDEAIAMKDNCYVPGMPNPFGIQKLADIVNFESDTTYMCYLTMEADSGYYFEDASPFPITVNGEDILFAYRSAKFRIVYMMMAGYDVEFDSNGGSEVATKRVVAGETLVLPADPTFEGKVFQGWFKDAGLTEPFDISAPIDADIVLYAKWKNQDVPPVDDGGSNVSVPNSGYAIIGEDNFAYETWGIGLLSMGVLFAGSVYCYRKKRH